MGGAAGKKPNHGPAHSGRAVGSLLLERLSIGAKPTAAQAQSWARSRLSDVLRGRAREAARRLPQCVPGSIPPAPRGPWSSLADHRQLQGRPRSTLTVDPRARYAANLQQRPKRSLEGGAGALACSTPGGADPEQEDRGLPL